jgi:hypothetical protein
MHACMYHVSLVAQATSGGGVTEVTSLAGSLWWGLGRAKRVQLVRGPVDMVWTKLTGTVRITQYHVLWVWEGEDQRRD